MKLLLTSAGISNPSIHRALVGLLGKPISQSRALFVPTAIYPFSSGPTGVYQAITGQATSPLCELGWGSLGVLELTALPSISEEVWADSVRQADVLLVWGGDPVFLAYWLEHSGLTELFGSLPDLVYVGVSAGSMAVAGPFAETYHDPPSCAGERLSSETLVMHRPDGDVPVTLVTAEGAGLVDFAIIPHVDHADAADVALAREWAARLPVPVYALDDASAVMVVDGAIEVVSEGRWQRFDR